ncbi:hypothetical protein DFQ28_005045 [Apophysomyces sp. BC1034]|nr:hypothetical protein DFQ30_002775 [Apophysomyces sp. BC1015]KAG0183040.1 hypothetical protein DFQ29_000461 [Apophysomyces sp. BC1021]KAG0194832.1 hypothetical protein DFQ28_005045 [Apophysomyces sp. BC1034]
MKYLTPEQEKECQKIGIIGGLKGAAIGLGIGAVATVMTFRRSPDFRALSRPVQSIMVASSGLAGFLFGNDQATIAYENDTLGYADEIMLENMQKNKGRYQGPMSTTDSVLHYLNDNRWSVIGISWAVSMVGALGISFSNRYLTTQQKVVQARMYAQAVTIAVLMASAGLSVYMDDEEKKHKDVPDAQLQAILELPDAKKYESKIVQ